MENISAEDLAAHKRVETAKREEEHRRHIEWQTARYAEDIAREQAAADKFGISLELFQEIGSTYLDLQE